MTSAQQPSDPGTQRHAWLLGSSIANLAAAVHLIQEAKVPASQVHFLESRKSPEEGIPTLGNVGTGYDHQAACFIFCNGCTEDLFSLVPSDARPGKTLLDDVNDSLSVPVPTRVLIKRDHKVQLSNTKRLQIGWKARVKLAIFMLNSEESLGVRKIQEFFDKGFFKSKFWVIWASTFGFSPWHGAVEFRRSVRKFFHEFFQSRTDHVTPNRSRYDPHWQIIVPITRFLLKQGADLKFNCGVMDMTIENEYGRQRVSSIQIRQDRLETTAKLSPHDIVIATLGSPISGSRNGTNTEPPCLELLPAEDFLGENWSLWLCVFSGLGDPYNLCTHVTESRAISFTITSPQGDSFSELINQNTSTIASIILPDSNWSLSLFKPHETSVHKPSTDVRTTWGYSSSPSYIGNFVKKPMLDCSGQEILVELLQHLGTYSETILHYFTVVPRVLPRIAAPLLSRHYEDRPKVIEDNISNLAVIGQFVEIPDETSATMDYSIRGAQMAVYRLMGVGKEPRLTRKTSISDILMA